MGRIQLVHFSNDDGIEGLLEEGQVWAVPGRKDDGTVGTVPSLIDRIGGDVLSVPCDVCEDVDSAACHVERWWMDHGDILGRPWIPEIW